MTRELLHRGVLRAAALLAPADRRDEWMRDWQSELWYVPPRDAARFCLGAFRDALWVRRNYEDAETRSPLDIESPLGCLALLATMSAAAFLVALWLPAPRVMGGGSRLSAQGVVAGSLAMVVYSFLLLPAMRLAMRGARAHRAPSSWSNRLRRWAFAAAKIALLQPMMFCGFLVLAQVGRVAPLAPMCIVGAWMLGFRWAINDQRRRCPVCLRLLGAPVRIGSASQTLLEWYGDESLCARGHGVLQNPEAPAGYSGDRVWLNLDGSWSGFISAATGARQR